MSLAAFLADSEGREAKVPFILDDPISSLDHEYEEAVARRLVELARSRQVIVFTHRLSLLAYLKEEARKVGVWGHVVSLSRYTIGDVGNLPIDLQSTKRAVNGLLNERLAAAKKAVSGGDAEYEPVAKGLCRDIRVLLERVVENDLLNEVVRRFHREVHTKGKIHALAGIDLEDCDLLDQLMTKYSAYEHSQPDEAPIALPSPEELASDLVRIAALIEKAQERNERYASRGRPQA